MSSMNSSSNIEDEKIYPFQMDYLPDFFRRKCELELNETSQSKKRIQELKTMIEGSQMLNGFNFEDDLLLQYLRHSKYDVHRSLKHLQKYVVLRSKHSHLFKSLPDFRLQLKNSENFIFPFPNRTPDGCTIVLTRAGKWDPRKLEYDDFVRSCMMVFCQLMRDPMTQINGFKIIHDFSGTSWRHYRYCTPNNLNFLLYATIDCIPARYKEMHFINDSFVMRGVWSVTKRFLSDKIRSRVYFHSTTEGLLDFFPRSVLPVEYGGELGDVCMEKWIRKANKEHKTNTIKGQPNFY